MDMDFLNTFQDKHYAPRLKQLFIDTSANISENYPSIQSSFIEAIDNACRDVIELQKDELLPEISYLGFTEKRGKEEKEKRFENRGKASAPDGGWRSRRRG